MPGLQRGPREPPRVRGAPVLRRLIAARRPRTVVITGASAGVGRVTARAFAAGGADVALIARGRAGLEAAAREVRSAGRRALVLPCDLADAEAVERTAEQVERELGEIDVWVNCAMTAVLAEVMETPSEEFRRVMDVNFLGYVHGTQAALRRMLPRNRGTIVFVGSALAERGIPLQATYCASKHAVSGFFDSLRAELRHRGADVHVTMVHLPGLNTTQFGWVRARTDREPRPVAPVYEPEVAARAIVWAATQRRRVIWVGLPTLYTILGDRLASWYMDRYLARHGYDGQQTDARLDPGRADYLLTPLDEKADRGAHGSFGRQARRRSLQLELNMRRRPLAALALAAAFASRRAVKARTRS